MEVIQYIFNYERNKNPQDLFYIKLNLQNNPKLLFENIFHNDPLLIDEFINSNLFNMIVGTTSTDFKKEFLLLLKNEFPLIKTKKQIHILFENIYHESYIDCSLFILKYGLEINYYTLDEIKSFIYYFDNDIIFQFIESYINDIHFIYEGTTILLQSINNVPLFIQLYNQCLISNFDINSFYINNRELTSNLDYIISLTLNDNQTLLEYFKYIFEGNKINYYNDLSLLFDDVIYNNFIHLELLFKKYKNKDIISQGNINANTRLFNNYPLIYFSNSLEMIYFLIQKGADYTLETKMTLDYINFYYINMIYTTFFLDGIFSFYNQSFLNYEINKKSIIKTIKLNENKNVMFSRLLSLSNKFHKINKKRLNQILIYKIKKPLYKDLTNLIYQFL